MDQEHVFTSCVAPITRIKRHYTSINTAIYTIDPIHHAFHEHNALCRSRYEMLEAKDGKFPIDESKDSGSMSELF